MSTEDSKVQSICDCLSILTEDIKIADVLDPNRGHPSIKEAFTADLKRNVHNTFLKIEEYPNVKGFVIEYIQPCCNEKCPSCDYLKFLQLCLVLLRLLKLALTKEVEKDPKPSVTAKAPQGLLSISQKKTLQKCLQFAVALGILPNLLRGIGIPLSKRLKHAIILEHFTSESTLYQKHIQIAVCLDTLIGCLDCEDMQSTILTYHGTDILAALLQLCHAPIKKIEKDEASSEEPAATDNTVTSETQIVNMMLAHRKYFAPHLETFLQHMCPSLLMWELLLFLGIPFQAKNDPAVKTPLWLRKICKQMLIDMILQSYGITRLVQVVLDKAFDSDIQSGKLDAGRMYTLARVITYITRKDVQHITLAEYIEKISKQVFHCLHLNNSPLDNILKYVAACMILQFCAIDIKSSEQHFLVQLLKPLWSCVRPSDNHQIKTIVKESDLTTCIEDLHQIFVIAACPLSRDFTKLIFPFSHCLCSMFFVLMKGHSHLKSKMKNLISNVITNSSDEEATALLYAITFLRNKDRCKEKVYITKVSFNKSDDGGIMAITKKDEEFSDSVLRYRAVLDMLSEIEDKNLNRTYILLVLKEFCKFHLESKDHIMEPKNVKNGILFNALLQEISEWDVDIGEALMSNISEVLEILTTLLESICTCRTDATFYEKTLWVVLMILNSILESDDQLSTEEWETLKECLPSLQALQMSDVDMDLKEIIFSIIIHIATHGAACRNGMDTMKDILANMADPANIKNMPSEKCLLSLIEKYERDIRLGKLNLSLKPSSVLSGARCCKRANHSKKCGQKLISKNPKDFPKKKESPYEAAMKEVRSPLIPTRGHGLIALGSLLRDKDQATVQNKKDLLKIFQENLEDEDSYVYLSAIQGLSLLADIDAELVLLVVLKMYQKSEKTSLVLKLGEVLVKITNSLGDMIHKYKDQLLHVFLVRTKHEDPQIRSSSLSNLGQTCLKLEFNINSHWLQEILICVLCFLKTDPDMEVRRCAVMVIYLLLKGVGKDMIKVLENEIKSIYMQLKIVYTTESDDVLRLHAQLSLEEINIIMKELLIGAKAALTKEIRILQ